MSMKVRPDYINPLTMMDKKSWQGLRQSGVRQKGTVSELQTKQQQLQNQMLLLKASGTDSAGASAETQKVLEAELEKVNAELRTAKSGPSQASEPVENMQPTVTKHSQDLYEPGKAQTASPGLYQVEKDEEQGWRISFRPCSE